MKKSEICCFLTHSKYDNQISNNDKNTENDFQLCWNNENKNELHNQNNIQTNWVWDYNFILWMLISQWEKNQVSENYKNSEYKNWKQWQEKNNNDKKVF